LHPQK